MGADRKVVDGKIKSMIGMQLATGVELDSASIDVSGLQLLVRMLLDAEAAAKAWQPPEANAPAMDLIAEGRSFTIDDFGDDLRPQSYRFTPRSQREQHSTRSGASVGVCASATRTCSQPH